MGRGAAHALQAETARWVPHAVAQGRNRRGVLVTVPTDIGPGTLLYRANLLARSGLDEAALTLSWDSYVAAGPKIKATIPFATGATQSALRVYSTYPPQTRRRRRPRYANALQRCESRGQDLEVMSLPATRPPYILGNFPSARIDVRCKARQPWIERSLAMPGQLKSSVPKFWTGSFVHR